VLLLISAESWSTHCIIYHTFVGSYIVGLWCWQRKRSCEILLQWVQMSRESYSQHIYPVDISFWWGRNTNTNFNDTSPSPASLQHHIILEIYPASTNYVKCTKKMLIIMKKIHVLKFHKNGTNILQYIGCPKKTWGYMNCVKMTTLYWNSLYVQRENILYGRTSVFQTDQKKWKLYATFVWNFNRPSSGGGQTGHKYGRHYLPVSAHIAEKLKNKQCGL
jgi:hypothetical protein